MITGARRLPLYHVTIRIPWHDGGWIGTVCARPLDNSICLILPRIGESRSDDVEKRCATATSICLSTVTIRSGLYLRIGICLVLLHEILSLFN